ncbi:hypothetical protein BY996DRAFT_6857820 [Phakopsora pachyrhizi]|nr:hypothetical protein BY996DRAFT_6857820 [Phakopsora pachyrhizi]
MQKQALFSLVLIASMMATASAGITSDKKEANYSESADLEQTLPVGPEKVYSSTSSNNRNFGASGFVASHVRMGQLDEFKSIIEDVVTNGGPLQSSLLNAENYGLPVHGSSYLHMKTNDNRIKTVFDSPPPGFVSSNKQVNSGISDSAGPEIVLDKGVCAITLNLDDKVVDHDRMILSWADHMIGEEHSNEGGRMHIYISTPNDPSRGKKIVDAPLNYIAGKDGSPLQLSKDQATFKTSGMNRRAVDLGSYINQKILMELFAVDKDNNPVDIGCALDDFHWESSNDPRVVQSTTAKLNRPSKRHLNILDNTLEQNPKTRDVEKSFNNEGPSREEMSGFPVSVTANGQIRDLEHDSEGAIYSPPKNRLSIPNSNVITSQKSGPESQLHPSTHSLKEEDETMDASKDGNRASSGLLSSFSKYLFAAKSKGQNFPSSTTKSPTSDELSESARDPNIIPTGSSSGVLLSRMIFYFSHYTCSFELSRNIYSQFKNWPQN